MISVRKEGLPDAVLWNPWADKANGMADMGHDQYRVRPINLDLHLPHRHSYVPFSHFLAGGSFKSCWHYCREPGQQQDQEGLKHGSEVRIETWNMSR